jgi:hypothetical protein
MTKQDEASGVLAQLWARIGARQWDRIAELLDPGVTVRYVHTGEVLDADGFVRANSDYPGQWRVAVEEIVGDGERAVALARVYDDEQTFYVASFASTAGGRITAMTEVWTDTGQPPHPSRSS